MICSGIYNLIEFEYKIQAESTTRLDVLIISVLTLLLVIATVFMLFGL
jgi:hypothetical protein